MSTCCCTRDCNCRKIAMTAPIQIITYICMLKQGTSNKTACILVPTSMKTPLNLHIEKNTWVWHIFIFLFTIIHKQFDFLWRHFTGFKTGHVCTLISSFMCEYSLIWKFWTVQGSIAQILSLERLISWHQSIWEDDNAESRN